jgi:hypothetical protein
LVRVRFFVLARHFAVLDAHVHDDLFLATDLFDRLAHVLGELLGELRHEFELEEALLEFLAHGLGLGVVAAIALGRGLHLLEQLAVLVEAARDLLGIEGRTGGIGLIVVARTLDFLIVLGIGDRFLGRGERLRDGGVFAVVDEAGDDVGDLEVVGLGAPVLAQEEFGDRREIGQRRQHLVEPVLDALGNLDLALAGEQVNGAHLAHVHAHRVGGAAELVVDRRERGCGFLGGFFVDVAVVQQHGIEIGRRLVDRDAHVVDHVDDIFDLLRIDDVVGQVVVDLVVGQKSLFLALRDEQLQL